MVEIDILSSKLTEAFEYYTDLDSIDVCVIGDGGWVTYSTLPKGHLAFRKGKWSDVRKCGNEALAKVVSDVMDNKKGITQLTLNKHPVHIGYAPIEGYDLYVLVILDGDDVYDPTPGLVSDIEKISKMQMDKVTGAIGGSYKMILLMLCFVVALTMVALIYLSYQLSESILRLSKKVENLSEDHIHIEWNEKAEYEVDGIASAFVHLTDRIEAYVSDITRITAERERIDTELVVASRIQQSLLPNWKTAFSDRDDFDISASMKAAKQVGGDFYDFFLIGDDHLCLVMADVSDKGVPAAVFMAEAKTRLRNTMIAKSKNDKGEIKASDELPRPEEIFAIVNNDLATNNDQMMFVTVWFGIIELSSGHVVASNAGHEYPVIEDENGVFSMMEDDHGFVIGAMEGMEYQGYEFDLPGECTLLLYTDGLAEANNPAKEQFGMERMLSTLNGATPEEKSSCEGLLEKLRSSVVDFVGEAEQFDDLTMMAFRRKEV